MASVHLNGTPCWNASIKIWHADKINPLVGKWKRTWRSTGIPGTAPKEEAEAVADALQAAALAAAPTNARRADQRTYVEALESIWEAAGLKPPPISSTWSDYAGRYLAERSLSPGTRAVYEGYFRTFAGYLGKRADDLLWNLGRDDFQGYYNSLVKEGRSAVTAGTHLSMLQAVMERAFLEGAISRNPVKLVNMTDGESAERHPFTREEIQQITAFLDRPPSDFSFPCGNAREWKTAMLLGLCCGLRLADATSRAWRDFNFTAGTLSLIPAKKARRGRYIKVPLAAPLSAHLSTLERQGEWITPNLHKKTTLSSCFVTILDRVGIDDERRGTKKGKGRTRRLKSFHGLRHTLNTWLAEAGAEKQIRMLISDHDDPKISDRYTHSTVERMASALEKVFPEQSLEHTPVLNNEHRET